MNWDETIKYIQKMPQYAGLVRNSYLEHDLVLNIQRFEQSAEYAETISIIQEFYPKGAQLLDVGSGNGISAFAFARTGYQVTALEPDTSHVAGVGAIRKIMDETGLNNIKVYQTTLEQNNIESNKFDIVYARQAMHHANNLKEFVAQAARLLKPGGIIFTARDHVVFNNRDKKRFLASHPLQKYYGGENAFSPTEYRGAFLSAGLKIIKELKFFDSVINYFPLSQNDINNRELDVIASRRLSLEKKIGLLSRVLLIFKLYNYFLNIKMGNWKGEKSYSGRMYSYVCIKPEVIS